MPEKRLYRSKEKILAGVLGGFAEYINFDPSLVRILFVVISLFTAGFPGLLFYIICALIIPVKPEV